MKRAGMLGWAIVAGVLCMTGIVLAGRPLAIDDADPVGPRQFEIEAGIAYEHDSDCRHWDFPFGLTYGLIPDVEVGVGFGGQFEELTEVIEDDIGSRSRESGIGDLVVGVKWQFIESCPLGARHALAASVKLPTSDEDKGLGSGETDCDLTWIASRSISDKTGVHLNLGYSWIGGPDHDVLHCGVAMDYQMSDAVQWVGEVFAEHKLADGADTVVQYNTGFRWNPVESVTLDTAIGSKMSGDCPDFIGTVGLTWAFGPDINGSK